VVYMLDARNSRVYYMIMKSDENQINQMGRTVSSADIQKNSQVKVSEISEVTDKVKGKAIFIGSGAMAYKDTIKKSLGKKAVFVKEELNKLSAVQVAKVGLAKYKNSPSIFKTEYLYKLQPLYILQPTITKPVNR
jgi:tRNA A37 threonylcarbamoyladenosine modification protein TsaB